MLVIKFVIKAAFSRNLAIFAVERVSINMSLPTAITPANAAIVSAVSNGGSRVLYHSQAGERYMTYLCLEAFCWASWCAPCREIKDRTYITVTSKH